MTKQTPDAPHPQTDLTPRDANGLYVRKIETAERDAEAARLKATGWTYQLLADKYGMSRRSAIDMVKRAHDAAGKADRDVAFAMELAKLDAMESAVLDVLTRAHLTVSHGQVVRIDGEPILDDGPVLQAVAMWLRVSERRSKLRGLDAPARSTVTVLTEDVVDAEIRRLEAEVASLTPKVARKD